MLACQMLSPVRSHAQHVVTSTADSFVVVTPGRRYASNAIGRTVLGSRYRDLWTTPIRIPVLDLRRVAGGLVPIRAHAGSQTKSLRFQGADGRQYQFRSVDKDPTARLSEELRHSVAGRALQDGVSASHPAASLVASALLEATSVLHVPQLLAVMPDDAALGEFRTDFAGLVGMLEERPDETDDRSRSFAGARRIISPTRLFERLDAGPDDRVDAHAFLVARLMDMFMGDRDRHRDQFRWASVDSGTVTYWRPISRDHDEAFVKLDGPVLDVVRLYFQPLIAFDEEYPAHDKLNWHSREIDRRLPVVLDRAAWDSVARSVQALLTDTVIDRAVRAMPPEMYAVDGARLAALLRRRRDDLVVEALNYYAFLTREVEVRGTDAPEVAEITRLNTHQIEVSLRERKRNALPFFVRRFDERETREVRLLLWGGRDSVIVRGDIPPELRLRIVGGRGDDVVIDSTRAGHLHVYDDRGRNILVSPQGQRTIDTRAFPEWIGSDLDRYPPREWGARLLPLPVVEASSDLGVVLGAGAARTTYGFRKRPYASSFTASLAYATRASALRFVLDGDIRRENRAQYWAVQLLASGFDLQHFYGAGNESAAQGNRRFHAVQQQLYSFEPSAVLPVGESFRLHLGPTIRWSRTTEGDDGFLASVLDTLYGAREFGQIGLRLGFDLDTRDVAQNARRGIHLAGESRLAPALWDAERAFSTSTLHVSAYRGLSLPLQPTVALRAGGQYNSGRYPFQASAFLGGQGSVRGLPSQRYAGRSSAFASIELRMTVGHTDAVFPALWGVYGGGDVGRVWADGTPSRRWHDAVGGGAWVAMLDRAFTMRLGTAQSAGETALYLGAGLPF